jgi:phage terminase large subunit GpA-like protein
LPAGPNGEDKGGWDQEAIAELTGEYRRQSKVRGYTVSRWFKRSGRPNHRLDCCVYALAALSLSRIKIDDCEIQRIEARNVGKPESEENARPPIWGAYKMAISGIPELGGVTGFRVEPDCPRRTGFGALPGSGLSF